MIIKVTLSKAQASAINDWTFYRPRLSYYEMHKRLCEHLKPHEATFVLAVPHDYITARERAEYPNLSV